MKLPFRDNRGSALVELALTCPLFFALIMGAAELGRVAYYAIEVENAARAGASYGAVNLANANSTSNVQQAALNDASDISNLLVTTKGSACVCEEIDPPSTNPVFTPSSGTASCTSSTITSCTSDTGSKVQSVIQYVTVSTSANVDPMIHVPGLPSTYNLSGYSALRILAN